jgi:hypothetical protein
MGLQIIEKFSNALSGYTRNSNGVIVENKLTDEQLYDAFRQFCADFENYTSNILKGKTFTDRELADYIFEIKFKALKQYQEALRRDLYAANLYLQQRSERINATNIGRYKSLLGTMLSDFEVLFGDIEVNYKNAEESITLHSWRKNTKHVRDILNVAKTLFFIDDAEQLSDIYAFDMRPYAIFPLRQLVEIYGKEILGLVAVEDCYGNFSKKHLYCAWEYIKMEIAKGADSKISIPFDIEVVLKIAKWSNRFVHTTIDAPYYTIFNAIRMLTVLFKSDDKPIKTYDGKRQSKAFGDITINDYDTLKQEFTAYINKDAKVAGQYVPVWRDVKSVSSYILSL